MDRFSNVLACLCSCMAFVATAPATEIFSDGFESGDTSRWSVVVGGDQCVPMSCGSSTYACGDCQDNDGDGTIDAADPDCLGPCDDSEDAFSLPQPTRCALDCGFDGDGGRGDDECVWDLECDPLTPHLNCEYDPNNRDCVQTQSAMCHQVCGPRTPNGCDCFGCCELPAHSGIWVYTGGSDTSGGLDCSLADAINPALCPECSPVFDCVNLCETCELCVGKTAVPQSCLPLDPLAQCPGGQSPCGLPGQSSCPVGSYCLTGCCQDL